MYELLNRILLAMCGLSLCVPPEQINVTQSTAVFNNPIKVDLSPQRFCLAVSPDLVCSVCTDVYTDPVALECGHVYCRTCIDVWLDRGSPTCPVDNKLLTTRSLIPIYPLKSLIDNLDIRCPFDVHGCEVTTKLSQVQDHGQQCPHNPFKVVVCNRRCGLNFSQATVSTHDCFDAILESHSKLQTELNALKLPSPLQPPIVSVDDNVHFVRDRRGRRNRPWP